MLEVDHHWQHWVLREDDGGTKILEMPARARNEMLCDWFGAGQAITGDGSWKRTRRWYMENRNKMLLHKRTRFAVERDLFCLEDYT